MTTERRPTRKQRALVERVVTNGGVALETELLPVFGKGCILDCVGAGWIVERENRWLGKARGKGYVVTMEGRQLAG